MTPQQNIEGGYKWLRDTTYVFKGLQTSGKAYIYPVMDHCWEESRRAPAQGRFESPTCRSTVEHANHQTTIKYTPGVPIGTKRWVGGGVQAA